jgi:uncharacterized protein (TIGR00369 family)
MMIIMLIFVHDDRHAQYENARRLQAALRGAKFMSRSEPSDRPPQMSGLDLLLAARDVVLDMQGMPRLIGAKILEVEPGRILFSALPESQHNNPLGTIYGGFTATLLDSAMGCALHAALPAGVGYTTLEFTISFVRPMKAGIGEVKGEGKVVHAGKSIALTEATLSDPEGKLVATATSTCMILRSRLFAGF